MEYGNRIGLHISGKKVIGYSIKSPAIREKGYFVFERDCEKLDFDIILDII